MQNFHWRLAPNWRATSQQVIKNRAETVHICCCSDTARIGRLFRRHVVRRAENRQRLREIAFALQPFRKAEVAHERFAGGIEKDISRLQIAMQNSVLVRKRDRACKLRGQCRCLARFVAIVVDSCRERSAIRELHAIKRRAVVLRPRRRSGRMLSWSRLAAASASARKRSIGTWRVQCAGKIIFSATMRDGVRCLARYTMPIPPRATSLSSS